MQDLLNANIHEFVAPSKCANQNEKAFLKTQLLHNKNFVTMLLYSGSIHGWRAKNFHERCDGKGPTLSLFKVLDGPCIGGYTKA